MDLEIEPQDTTLRTNVDGGPAKQRRRFTAATRRWTFTLGPITGAEKVVFETWHRVDLKGGALAFDWHDEAGVVRSFRFIAVPRPRPIVPNDVPELKEWEIPLVLEVLP